MTEDGICTVPPHPGEVWGWGIMHREADEFWWLFYQAYKGGRLVLQHNGNPKEVPLMEVPKWVTVG